MSLINEMLKDLEARGETPAREAPPRAPREGRHRPARTLVVTLAALVLVLAGVVGGLLWLQPAPAVSASTVATSLNTPVPGRQAAAKPASHQALTETTREASNMAAAETMPPAPVAEVVPEVFPGPVPEIAADSGPEITTEIDPGAAIPTANDAVDAAATKPQADVPEPSPAAAAQPGPAESPGALIVRRHEPTPEQRAMRAGRDGLAALARNDWLAASRLLQEVVALEPANDAAREALVVALTRQGRIAEAEGVLLDGLAVGVEPARFAKLRARLQVARDDLDGALDSLSVAVPEVADDPEYHALRGAIAQQAGEHALAAVTYRRLLALEPGHATWQAGLGMALDGLNQFADARAAYQRALEAGGLEPALLEHVRARLAALANATNEDM